MGVAIAVFHAASALVAPSYGRLVQRIGALQGVRLAALGSAAAACAIALLADSVPVLLGLLVVAGVANGGAGPASASILRDMVAAQRRGLAFGAQQSGAPVGVLLAGAALPLLAVPFGWRWAFAAVIVVGGLAIAAAPRAGAAPRTGAPPAESAPDEPAPGPASSSDVRLVYLLSVAAAFASAVGTGLVTFLVVFAVDAGVDERSAGVLLVVVSCAAICGRISVGAGIDRTGVDPLVAALPLLVAGALGMLLLLPAAPVAIAAGAVIVGGLGWAWPVPFVLATVRQAPAAPAWAVGVMMSGLYAGAVAGPLLVGILAARLSFAWAWAACAVLALLASAAVAAVARLRSRTPAVANGEPMEVAS
jgi:predicted MFS family arabinose efflux permease